MFEFDFENFLVNSTKRMRGTVKCCEKEKERARAREREREEAASNTHSFYFGEILITCANYNKYSHLEAAT